jgi:prephenate dehydrogenase
MYVDMKNEEIIQPQDGSRPLRIIVIGGGLVGGSAAQALFTLDDIEVSLVDIAPEVRRLALEYGIESQLDLSNLDDIDLALLAVPPDQTASSAIYLLQTYPSLIVSDTASVKGDIDQEIRSAVLPSQLDRWVPGHPLVGGGVGWKDAKADLHNGHTWLLFPSESNAESLTVVESLLGRIGASVQRTALDDHDITLAYTSHAVQLVACALQLAVADNISDRSLSGTGLKDTTRVARLDPEMWKAIVASNQPDITQAIDDVQQQLISLQELIAAQDWQALGEWLASASASRSALEAARWP